MTPAARRFILDNPAPWLSPNYPLRLNPAFWYDISDVNSLRNNAGAVPSSGDGIKLIGDKSGNSAVNVLAQSRLSSTQNNAWLTTGAAVTTGEFTISARHYIPTNAELGGSNMGLGIGLGPATSSVGGSGADAFYIWFNQASDALLFAKRSAADVYQIILQVNSFGATYGGAVHVITLRRDGTEWRGFIDGVSVANGTNFFAENVDSTRMMTGVSAGNLYTGRIEWARLYSTGLSNAAVLADAQGTVQANNVVNCDYSLFAKLAASGACATGQTVTVVSAGDLGARISGARDAYQGTAANQAVYLPWSGTNYGYLNGASGTNYSTPDSAAVSVTGSIDLIARIAAVDYTTAAFQGIICKADTDGQCSWTWDFTNASDGKMRFWYTPNGTVASLRLATSTAAVPFSDKTGGWIRVTYNSATGDVIFYTAADSSEVPSSWTQLGTTVSITAGAIFDGTSAVRVGSGSATANPFAGYVYRAQIYNGIAGTLASDFNPPSYTSGTTFTAPTGEVWTLNGGATIVTRTCLYYDGSNDYHKTPAFALAQPVSIYAVLSQPTWTANEALYDGNASNSMLLQQKNGGVSPEIAQYAGNYGGSVTAWAVNVRAVISAVYNNTASILRLNRTAGVTGTVGTNTANGFAIGANGSGSLPANITVSEVLGVARADATYRQDPVIMYAGRKWKINV